MHFTADHPRCGTAVGTELPAGYPVEEGVGLFCMACREAWWAEPAAAAAQLPGGSRRTPVPIAAGAHEAPAPVAAGPHETPAPVAARPREAPVPVAAGPCEASPVQEPSVAALPAALVGPARPAAPADVGAVRRWWPAGLALAAFVTLAVVVALSAVDPGGVGTRAVAQPTVDAAVPTVTQAPAGTAAPAATPAPRRVERTVAGRRVSATVPDGWTVRRRARGVTYASPGAAVRVTAGPREGRDLRRLGRDARRALDRASRAPLRRVRVGGRPAVAVRAAGQEIVQVADGPRRWLISRPADAGADVARSLRIRPGA